MRSEAEVRSWRAIEALRAGVPNRDAVQALGSTQAAVEERFRRQLRAAQTDAAPPPGAAGLLVAGAFGTGKSHLLEYLHHIALEQNFVASKVVISKETPLYDPAKVYAAAIQAARAPDRAGAGLTEIARKINVNSPEYARFYQWVSRPDAGLAATFLAATVLVFERYRGESQPEVADRLVQFWSGSPLQVGTLKTWLRDMRETATYTLRRVTDSELTLERLRFAPQLIRAAGYAGWAVFLDEVELVRNYTLQQRTRSYREIARWLGGLQTAVYPGLTTVLSINSEFELAVLDRSMQGGKKDEEQVPARARARGQELLAAEAETGMRLVRQHKVLLESPTEATIRDIRDQVRAIYREAYGWQPPDDSRVGDRTALMRQHVKRWIHEWDLRRLYEGYTPQVQIGELRQDYSEQRDLETPPEADRDEEQYPAE